MAIFCGLAQRLHKDGRNVNQTWRSQNLINSDQSQEIKPKFNQTFVDYPQEPKVYPGERIPTILDDLEEMPPKEPTILADADKRYFFAMLTNGISLLNRGLDCSRNCPWMMA